MQCSITDTQILDKYMMDMKHVMVSKVVKVYMVNLCKPELMSVLNWSTAGAQHWYLGRVQEEGSRIPLQAGHSS